MTTKQDYTDTLERLHLKAVTSLLDKGQTLQPNKVACIVAVGELRDGLEKAYGKGNVPTDALLAMRDHMQQWA